MADREKKTPRRAVPAEDSIASEPTAAPTDSTARRGAARSIHPEQDGSAVSPSQSQPSAQDGASDDRPTESVSTQDAANQPTGTSPDPAAPSAPPTSRPATQSAPNSPPSPTTAPGQSISAFARPGVTPTEWTTGSIPQIVESPNEPTPAAPDETPTLAGHAPRRSAGSEPSDDGPLSWLAHHRRTVIIWISGALVLALLVVLGSFAIGRLTSPDPTATGASPTQATGTGIPLLTTENLITAEDADNVVSGASWVETQTVESAQDIRTYPACLSAESTTINSVSTLQRSLGTSQADSLALLQKIEVFANADAAATVFAERQSALATCDEVPARIVSASNVTGAGDEAAQVTVAYEEDETLFHTVLLTRTGSSISIIDVVRTGEPVDASATAAGVQRSLAEICGPAEGTCPSEIEVTATPPAAVEPVGWLIPSDLPRITSAQGKWTANDVVDLSAVGTGCEDMTLASASGPNAREQRTYLMTQDQQAPSTFGLDELRFTFDEADGANSFAGKLTASIGGCTDRLLTAEVNQVDTFEGTGADDQAYSGTIYNLEQATDDDNSVYFQLIVTKSDNQVSYLIATVTSDYRFSDDQLRRIANRTGQRTSQG